MKQKLKEICEALREEFYLQANNAVKQELSAIINELEKKIETL